MPGDLEAVFETISAHAARLFPMDAFSIALCGPGPNEITQRLAVERGIRQVPHVSQPGDGLSDLVLRTRNPVLVRDFRLVNGSAALSWMGAPLAVEERVLGIIYVQCFRQGAFDERDLSILSSLAGWAASAVDSAERIGLLQKEASSCAAILRVARSLAAETEQLGLFKVLAESVFAVIECDVCSTWSFAEYSEQLLPAWWWQSGGHAIRMDSEPFAPAPVPAIAESLAIRKPLVVPEGDGWRLGPAERQRRGAASAVVPLLTVDEVVGLAMVERSMGKRSFTARELAVLQQLAELTALSIRGLRHSQRTSRQSAVKEMLDVRSRLVSTVSHELRTPLSLIQAGTELLMGDLTDPSQVRQVAGLVNQGTVRLAEVVDDIVEFADLQSEVEPCDLVPIDPAAVVRDAIHAAVGAARSHRVNVEATEPLPRVPVNARQLRSAVARLVKNAINFSQESSQVLVRVSVESKRLRIEVRDGGLGIPSEEIDRVFQPFFKGRTGEASSASGTGLGLSIVKHLVESMGGEIDLRSQIDRGTVAVITIPIRDPSGKPEGVGRTMRPGDPGGPSEVS